jgi:hypothetical protein
VLGQHRARHQGDDCLTQDMFMATHDGVRGMAAARPSGTVEQFVT